MQTTKQHLGEKGENLAVDYLTKKGYKIIKRNFRIGRAEVDIIAETKTNTVFVEVKTRSCVTYGYPETFVTKKQESIIIQAAETYVANNKDVKSLRYDIISIILSADDLEIMHFEDAFWSVA
jgi:putative endonuclease